MNADTIVFIDGGYLSKISKYFGNGKYIPININKFAVNLAESQKLLCKSVYYYTAPPFQNPVPTESERVFKAKYDKFISKLIKINNFIVREGRCQKVNGEFKQKGVDTLLTMDLMRVAISKEVDTIIIIASDTDFVPILKQVRAEGIKVVLFYFSDFKRRSNFSMSNHILTACDKCVLLKKDDFERSLLNSKA